MDSVFVLLIEVNILCDNIGVYFINVVDFFIYKIKLLDEWLICLFGWYLFWCVVIIGILVDIVELILVIDVSELCKI